MSIIPLLLSSLAGSATISIHSTSLPLLFKTYQYLKSDPSFLSPTIIEPWLRQYQVLPGRTHPEMSGMGHGGYLLNCFRVFDDEEAISVTASGRRGPGFGKGKKRKAEEEARKEAEGKIAKFEVVEGESVESEVMVDESRIIDENMVVVDDLNLLKPDTLIEVETKI